jgi:hypothetical protein
MRNIIIRLLLLRVLIDRIFDDPERLIVISPLHPLLKSQLLLWLNLAYKCLVICLDLLLEQCRQNGVVLVLHNFIPSTLPDEIALTHRLGLVHELGAGIESDVVSANDDGVLQAYNEVHQAIDLETYIASPFVQEYYFAYLVQFIEDNRIGKFLAWFQSRQNIQHKKSVAVRIKSIERWLIRAKRIAKCK